MANKLKLHLTRMPVKRFKSRQTLVAYSACGKMLRIHRVTLDADKVTCGHCVRNLATGVDVVKQRFKKLAIYYGAKA